MEGWGGDNPGAPFAGTTFETRSERAERFPAEKIRQLVELRDHMWKQAVDLQSKLEGLDWAIKALSEGR